MPTRPSELWRSDRGDPEPALDALWRATDAVLETFETDLRALTSPTDDDVFRVIEHVIVSLNEVAYTHPSADFDTIDREELCDYIDGSLTEAGIDVDALAARRGVERSEITSDWRDW